MNLTWHIVRKDVRRLGAPVAGWVVFTAGLAWWFGGLRIPEEVARSGDPSRWMSGVSSMAGVAFGLQIVAGMLLAGGLVLEDVVGSANAGWRTRPISGGRLLGAKVIAAGLLLVVAPTVALVPVWVANGFSAGECALTGLNVMESQGAAILLALGVASLVENVAQFTFAGLAVSAAFLFCASKLPVNWLGLEGGPKSGMTAMLVTLSLPLVAGSVVLVQRYLTRRTRRCWLAIGLTMVAALGVRAVWTWEFLSAEKTGDPTPAVEKLPLRVGAEARVGSDYLRVANVSDGERGQAFRVMLEEHGSAEIVRRWPAGPGAQVDFGRWNYRLVDRNGTEVPLTIMRTYSTGILSLALRVWELEASGPLAADEAEGAVLRRVLRSDAGSAAGEQIKGQP